ncbi:MAG: hypothetical protein GQ563_05295, partial [Desulfuromusa sp.]|nr:hypothetical protein [Desulfuromusa sp.]
MEAKIKQLIEDVLREMGKESATALENNAPQLPAEEPLADLTKEDLKEQLLVPDPSNR